MLDNSQLIFALTGSKIYAKKFSSILESTRSDIPPVFVYLQHLHNLSAMMWMVLFLILLPLVADGWYFRRHRRTYRYRSLLLALVAASDLLPLAGIVLFWLVRDNTSGVMTAAMWIFFAYLLLTLPRMAYYVVRAFGSGRVTRMLALLAALGMTGVLIQGATSGRRTLVVHRVAVYSDRLPEAFDGLRIAQFTDLHIGTLLDADKEIGALVDSLNALQPDLVIFCGDLNVAHNEIDLKNPKTNRKNAGFSDEERAKFTELLEAGFVDTFRYFYPEQEGIYSWWSYRFSARAKNAGWRIDYFCVSESLKDRLVDAEIHTEVMGSDHCPVELDIQ